MAVPRAILILVANSQKPATPKSQGDLKASEFAQVPLAFPGVFFSSLQRINENTNRLLRHYFLKGTDLSVHSQEHLDAVARELKERPRMTLNYFSSAEKFEEWVAAIG